MGYKFKTKPFKHQFRFLKERGRDPFVAMGWQMRTGKSKACVDNAAALLVAKQITGMIVFAPNGVHEDWEIKQLAEHCGVPYDALVYKSGDTEKKKFLAKLDEVCTPDLGRLKVLLVNDESCWREKTRKIIGRFMKAHPTFFFVVDECHRYGKPTSKRTRVAQFIGKKAKYVRILSGTLTGNSPLRIWSQFEIGKHGALGFNTFTEFKFEYAIEQMMKTSGGRSFPTITGYRNQEDLRRRMAPYMSVVLREDCDDMPKLLPIERVFEPIGKQRALFDQLVKKSYIEMEETKERIAYDGGVKALKMKQILSGFWIGEGKTINQIFANDNENPRLALLANEIENVHEAGEKAIVWCEFKEDIRKVMALCERMGVSAAAYYGEIDAATRRKNEVAFREQDGPTILVAQPKAGGAGKDFASQWCKTIIWYQPTKNLIDFEQASERATKIGGFNIAVIHILANVKLDRQMAKDLEERIDIADMLSRGGLARYLDQSEAA